MVAANQAKVFPYILVIPSPSPPPSPSLEQTRDDSNNRERKDKGGLAGLNCNCASLLLGGLGLVSLLAASIAIPLVLSLSTSKGETTSTIITTTLTMTTVTDTTATTTSTTSDTSTSTSTTFTRSTTSTSTSTASTTSTSTLTTSTTDLPCSPTCTSQQTCVNGVCVGIGYLSCTLTWSEIGDGDIVVATPNNDIIYYSNRGPSYLTDGGQLDVDNTHGTGPENVFWTNSSSVPPTGVYYVCFSQFSFSPPASSTNPITATVRIVRSTNSTLVFTQQFTYPIKDTTACDSGSSNLLGSFTYP